MKNAALPDKVAVVVGGSMPPKLSRVKAQDQAALDLAYWLSRPVSERIEALEMLRNQMMATLPDAQQRLQRVCRVVKRERR